MTTHSCEQQLFAQGCQSNEGVLFHNICSIFYQLSVIFILQINKYMFISSIKGKVTGRFLWWWWWWWCKTISGYLVRKKNKWMQKIVKTSHLLMSFTERSNTQRNITHYRQGNDVFKNLNAHKTQYYLYIAAVNKWSLDSVSDAACCLVDGRGGARNPQLTGHQMRKFWSSLNYNLQIILSELQLILYLKFCDVRLQNRTFNSANIETNAKRKAVVGTSLFINNNFPTCIHVTLLILIRKKGSMLHILTWYKCWILRFASSSPIAAGFFFCLWS